MSKKKEIIKYSPTPNQRLFVGSLGAEYMNALFSDNPEKIRVVESHIEEKEKENKHTEYTWMKTHLNPLVFDVFTDIDKLASRHIGWTDRAIYHGKFYKYNWYYNDIEIDYKDYGKFTLMIGFMQEKFELYIYYCDETGYDQGKHSIIKNIEPSNLFQEIENLRTKVVDGFKIKE